MLNFSTPSPAVMRCALGALYDRYRVILFGLLVRILNSREEAEDVLQEVMLQVWRRAAILMSSEAGLSPGW